MQRDLMCFVPSGWHGMEETPVLQPWGHGPIDPIRVPWPPIGDATWLRCSANPKSPKTSVASKDRPLTPPLAVSDWVIVERRHLQLRSSSDSPKPHQRLYFVVQIVANAKDGV